MLNYSQMATATDFPITTSYGNVPGYPLNNGFHKGVDRIMPVGTPVLVNGVQIGLSGNTGYVTGAHLHIGKMRLDATLQDPGTGGFSFKSAKVISISEDPINGKYVRIQADGFNWVYLHLSKQTCVAGQVLLAPAPPKIQQQGDEMIDTADRCGWLYKMLRPNYNITQAELDGTINKRTYGNFIDSMKGEILARDASLSKQTEALQSAQNEAQTLRATITQIQQTEAQEDIEEQAKSDELSRLNAKLSDVTNDLQKALLEVERLHGSVTQISTPEPAKAPEDLNWLAKLLAMFVPKAKV